MVYRTHASEVWRALLVMTAGRRSIADEATAEAFARLFDHRVGVREPLAWVYRTAYRLAAEELRRERREPPANAPGGEEPWIEPGSLGSALTALPPQQRMAVFLHYYADLPVAEIAHRLDVPVATVKVRLHRARRALRGLLGEETTVV